MDIGADGFPKLPEVSSMLGSASQTIQNLTAEALALQAQISITQKEMATRMVRQKHAYEEKLKAQEGENLALVEANLHIAQANDKLKGINVKLRKHIHDLQSSNQ